MKSIDRPHWIPCPQFPIRIGVCVTEEAFNKVKNRFKHYKSEWTKEGSGGSMHQFREFANGSGKLICIVTVPLEIHTKRDISSSYIPAMLMHELMHVSQALKQYIGEYDDGTSEWEPYLAQHWMQEAIDFVLPGLKYIPIEDLTKQPKCDTLNILNEEELQT